MLLRSILVLSENIIDGYASRLIQEIRNVKLRCSTERDASLAQYFLGNINLIDAALSHQWLHFLIGRVIPGGKRFLHLFSLVGNKPVNLALGDCDPILGLPLLIELVSLLIFEHIFIHRIIFIFVVILHSTFEQSLILQSFILRRLFNHCMIEVKIWPLIIKEVFLISIEEQGGWVCDILVWSAHTRSISLIAEILSNETSTLSENPLIIMLSVKY